MLIKITAPKQVFTNLLDAVLVMQKEALVKLTPEGVICNVSSLDHTAAVFINYPKEMFTGGFEVAEAVQFGIKADDVKKRLARCGQNVTFELVDGTIKIKSDDKTYGVALFNTEGFDKHPKFTFPTKIILPRADLKRIFGDVAVVSAFIKIATKGEQVIFSGQGDLASDNVDIAPIELVDVEGPDASASYTLATYLIPMVDAVETETATIEFGNKQPLRLTLGNVQYFLGAKANE